ncbi:MAG: hypothetical protein AB1421_03465 [Pseudomonadota bacterium]
MKHGKLHSVLAAAMLALGASGNAAAGTTYTYTYDYNLSVNGCSGTWYSSCGLSGSQTGSTVNPAANAPADPNAPAASISASAAGWANTQGNQWTASSQTLEKGEMQAWGGVSAYVTWITPVPSMVESQG